MTTHEGSSRRSPELWFGVLAAIAIPTLLLRLSGLFQSLWPAGSEAIHVVGFLRLALALALIPLVAMTGFALRRQHAWAVGLLAGTVFLLVPDERYSGMVLAGAPRFALVMEWTFTAVAALVPMAVAAMVLYRFRYADYVAVAMAVCMPLVGVGFILYDKL